MGALFELHAICRRKDIVDEDLAAWWLLVSIFLRRGGTLTHEILAFKNT